MNTLNLNVSDPAMLVERATPHELLAAIRSLESWDEQALSTVSRLISVWSARAIASPNDQEGISELQRLIHFTINRARSSTTLPDEFRYRWMEASDMLEARRLNLAHGDPEAQLNRRHVPEILKLIFEAGNKDFPQSRLADRLGITAGRVTQLVGPLEANGLITKRKHGHDHLLCLTEAGFRYASEFNRHHPDNPEKSSS